MRRGLFLAGLALLGLSVIGRRDSRPVTLFDSMTLVIVPRKRCKGSDSPAAEADDKQTPDKAAG